MKDMKCYDCVLKHLAAALSYAKEIRAGHDRNAELDHRPDLLGELVNAEHHLELLDPALCQSAAELRKKLQEKIKLFADNPLAPTLRNHALKGKYKEYRSIDITGDVRALYLQQDNEAIFDAVGTHSQLYG